MKLVPYLFRQFYFLIARSYMPLLKASHFNVSSFLIKKCRKILHLFDWTTVRLGFVFELP